MNVVSGRSRDDPMTVCHNILVLFTVKTTELITTISKTHHSGLITADPVIVNVLMKPQTGPDVSVYELHTRTHA